MMKTKTEPLSMDIRLIMVSLGMAISFILAGAFVCKLLSLSISLIIIGTILLYELFIICSELELTN